MKRWIHDLGLAGVALAATLGSVAARADVQKLGDWPAQERKVTFEFDGAPSAGLRKLAAQAGWSLVVTKNVQLDAEDVHVSVKDQPADTVLKALFAESQVVARRTGSLVTLSRAGDAKAANEESAPSPEVPRIPAIPAIPPTPPIPPNPRVVVSVTDEDDEDGEHGKHAKVVIERAAPVPTVRGEDRSVMGGKLVVQRGEIVHDLTVTGGKARILGTVTGDLTVAGGAAVIESGARVVGNVSVFGGSVRIQRDGRVDGSMVTAGGSIKREDGAIVNGKVVGAGRDDDDDDSVVDEHPQPMSALSAKVHSFGRWMTQVSLLFVLGCIFLALAGDRMDRLRAEIATRPMRSFALGIVGSIAAFVAFIVLCITIVGLPVALVGLAVSAVAVAASAAAILTTGAAAIIGHRTKNPYVHLLVGCGALLVVGAIPFVGGIAKLALTMMAAGLLVATRCGGLLGRRRPNAPTLT